LVHQEFIKKGREWEDLYRDRYNHAKRVRSTHGVNCTGSCSWFIFVKDGVIITEMPATDYPIINDDVPPYEPRGCSRGASFSWYEYSPHRIKYPYIRKSLLRLWREALEKYNDPVSAWESIVEDKDKSRLYKEERGKGGFVRSTWKEVTELISSSIVYTIKKYGPDRIFGFTPIPAMSMVSYASGTRFLSLIGGVVMSFYDWYADLPIASPQVWGEQTDAPESADWYNATYIIDWGTNIAMTRTPDAHFYAEARYRGTKVVAVSPDYADFVKFADVWIHPRPGTDGALALAMAHVIAKEFHVDRKVEYFENYLKRFTDAPFLILLKRRGNEYVLDRFLRASHIDNVEKGEWKLVVFDKKRGRLSIPNGSIGFRWSEGSKWNLKMEDSRDGAEIDPALTFFGLHDDLVSLSLPVFDTPRFVTREVPVKRIKMKDGKEAYVTTVFDVLLANLGVKRGNLKGYPESYEEDEPYTPRWQESITTVPKDLVIKIAREFAKNAEESGGKSLVLLGAGVNHWFHSDLLYRGIITILLLIGAVGVNGGGWAHYVGQEKVRTFEGWNTIAFARDWVPATRLQNTTSWVYFHTDQWRYDGLTMNKLSLDKTLYEHPADYNVLAVRRGWLPFYPQFNGNPLEIVRDKGENAVEKTLNLIRSNDLSFSISDVDNTINFPRILFVWRANLLFSSGKGSEYFLKHLLGTHNFVENVEKAKGKVREIKWRDPAPQGKLDLLVTLDFRMSGTALYSDVVLPAATWYEKHDLSSTDMHTFVHPFNPAIDPSWESKNDWDIFKLIAKKFSELAKKHLGKKIDVLYLPLMHDTPDEISQHLLDKDALDRDQLMEEEFVPGKTMGKIVAVERDYTKIHDMMITIGPLVKEKSLKFFGIDVNLAEEYEELKKDIGEVNGKPSILDDINVAEAILRFSSGTNGEVAKREYKYVEKVTGLDLSDLYDGISEIKYRFKDLVSSPKRVVDTPIESGIVKKGRTASSFTFNIEYLVPWRTLSGRQHFYLDHPLILEEGEGLPVYKPPLNEDFVPGEEKGLVIRVPTPHGKWNMHTTFMDNLFMLQLFRGGPVIWLNEEEAKEAGINDNDWVAVKNENGVVVVRAVLSHRIPKGIGYLYHAQERTVNVGKYKGIPGGAHNAITRVQVKPTEMIGGYAQFSYFLNYYGPVGTQRDAIALVKKVEEK